MATRKDVKARAGVATQLLHNPHQEAFLRALRARVCPKCGASDAAGVACVCGRTLEAADLRAYHRLSLIAGRRGGKTRIGSVAALLEASRPNTVGIVAGPTFGDLHDFIWPHIFSQLPEAWIRDWSEQHQELILKNGSVIRGRSLDDPEKIRGHGLHWLWIDEAAKVAEKAWDIARPSLTEHRGVAWFTTTPAGFNWVYQRLWLPCIEGEPGFWATKYRTADNPIIASEELDEAQRTMSADFYRQEYEADFTDFRGAIYGGLILPAVLRTDEDIKRVLPEWPRIDPSRQCVVGIDPGAGEKHPTAAAAFVMTEAGLVGIGEYEETTKPISYHAPYIKRLSGPCVPLYTIDRQRKQEQIEFAQHGIFAAQVEAGPGSVAAGIDRVKAWLERGQMYFIESRMPRTIAELSTYRWRDPETSEGELVPPKPFKMGDDLADCVRYVVMHWPTVPAARAPDGKRPLASYRPEDRAYIQQERARFASGDSGLEPSEPDVALGMGEFYS